MHGLGRILGFGLFSDYNEIARTSYGYSNADVRLVLFQCRRRGCWRFARTSAPRPVCEGLVTERHEGTTMRQIRDQNQAATRGLVVDGQVQ
jgi:hypothetical protein